MSTGVFLVRTHPKNPFRRCGPQFRAPVLRLGLKISRYSSSSDSPLAREIASLGSKAIFRMGSKNSIKIQPWFNVFLLVADFLTGSRLYGSMNLWLVCFLSQSSAEKAKNARRLDMERGSGNYRVWDFVSGSCSKISSTTSISCWLASMMIPASKRETKECTACTASWP